MKENNLNRIRISDEVLIAAIEMLGKVLLAFITSRGTHTE